MRPVGLPVKVWKVLRGNGVQLLVRFFNWIMSRSKIQDSRKKSYLESIYKNKGMYKSVKIIEVLSNLSHTMKLWEKVIEKS